MKPGRIWLVDKWMTKADIKNLFIFLCKSKTVHLLCRLFRSKIFPRIQKPSLDFFHTASSRSPSTLHLRNWWQRTSFEICKTQNQHRNPFATWVEDRRPIFFLQIDDIPSSKVTLKFWDCWFDFINGKNPYK